MKLKEICTIGSGQGAPQNQSDYCEQGHSFIKASDLDRVIRDGNETGASQITDEAVSKYKLREVPPKSVLFAKSGLSCMKNRVYLTKETCYAVNHLCVLSGICSAYDPYWLAHYIKHYDVTRLIKDLSYPSIQLKHVGEIDVPSISIEKQKRESARLSAIEESISVKASQLANLDALVKSRFIEMFGDAIKNEKKYKTKNLSDCCSIMGLKNYPKRDLYWLLNLDKIESQSGRILDKEYKTLAEIGNSTYYFDDEYVLYSKLRPYLNKVALPDENGFATTELVPLKPQHYLNRVYLAYLLRSDSFVSWINSQSAGTKMPRASMDSLRKFQVMIPPIDDQILFANFVSRVDKSEFVVHSRYLRWLILTFVSSTIAYSRVVSI